MRLNGHEFGLPLILTVIGMVCALAASWYVWGEQKGKMDERVGQVEKRQEEDRKRLERQLERIEERGERTDRNVQDIRILIEGMKAQMERSRNGKP